LWPQVAVAARDLTLFSIRVEGEPFESERAQIGVLRAQRLDYVTAVQNGVTILENMSILPGTQEVRGMMIFFLRGCSSKVRASGRLRVVSLMASLFVTILSAGCSAMPKAASELGSTSSSTDSAANRDPVALSDQYWKRSRPHEIGFTPGRIIFVEEKDGQPDVELTAGRRIAITEFAVEFVNVQFQKPFGRQPMFKAPIIPVPSLMLLVHLGFELSGIARRQTPMPEDDQQATSEALYAAFEQYLRERGMVVIPRKAVAASPSYAKLKSRPSVNSSPALFLNPVLSDTGIAMRTEMVSAPGLGITTCGAADLADAEARISGETGADVVMAVRLRVGTYRKKAALEQNSVIRLKAATGQTTFTARHSLLSDGEVAARPSRNRIGVRMNRKL
jgi:hypothetical protein